MKRACVAIIRGPNNTVLMGKRADSQKWVVPAGHVDQNECPIKAICREVKEETGLAVIKSKLVKVEKTKDVMLYVFECEVTGEIDHTKDPDKEYCQKPEYCNIVSKYKELHIPPNKNVAFKYLVD